MSKKKPTPSSRPITATGIAGVATVVVGLCAGVIAARTTHDVALRTGAVRGEYLAWLLPACIEGAAIAAALLRWVRGREGSWGLCWQETSALVAIMTVSVWVNASHVVHPNPLAVVLAAAPPIVLVGSLELLLRRQPPVATTHGSEQSETPAVSEVVSDTAPLAPEQVSERSSESPIDHTATDGSPTESLIERPSERVRERSQSPKRASTATSQSSSGRRSQDERVEKVAAIVAELGRVPSGGQIAKRHKVSPATGGRWKAAYEAAQMQVEEPAD